jgi:hypothetical protein
LTEARLFTCPLELLEPQLACEPLRLPCQLGEPVVGGLTSTLAPLVRGDAGEGRLNPDAIGWIFEALLTLRVGVTEAGSRFQLVASPERKRTGSFFTPPPLLQAVVSSALAPWEKAGREELLALKICDPAMGGGAFLLEAGRQLQVLLSRGQSAGARDLRREIVQRCLHGVDIDPWAVAVAEVSLWLFVADPALSPVLVAGNLRTGDALVDSVRKVLARARWTCESMRE